MLKKFLKAFGIIALVSIIVLSGNIMVAFAVSQSDLDNINDQIDKTKDNITVLEEKLSGVMKQIQSLNAEIAEYENDIADLDTQIDSLNAQINEAEIGIKDAEEKYHHQLELLKTRIAALYEAGDTTYLDVLLSSKSITDFIDKYYTISEILESDKNLMGQMEDTRVKLEESKQVLETGKEQIEALKKSKVDTANSLKQSQAVKQTYVDQLNDEEKALEEDLEQFERDKKEIQDELRRIAMENNGGKEVIPGDPTSAGYIFPVEDCGFYSINRKYYPSYPGHTGTDINIGVYGKRVLAVKAGTVVTSTALRNSYGEYRSYGEYIVIDHHDGTMTLYGHMSPNSRTVSKGDEVTQGQVIGIVGTTGNSTGYHLHFEVRINGRCVNPLPYLQ